MKKIFLLIPLFLLLANTSFADFGGPFGKTADVDGFVYIEKSVTFDGGTTNDIGDFDGTGNPSTLFNITGIVQVQCYAECTDSLTGASATVESVAGVNTASFITKQDQVATFWDAGEVSYKASTTAEICCTASVVSPLGELTLTDGDIVQRVEVANITGGSLTYKCKWKRFSNDGNMTVAE